jgi:hypothetical protein
VKFKHDFAQGLIHHPKKMQSHKHLRYSASLVFITERKMKGG